MMALLNLPEHHYSHYKDHHYAGIPAQNMLLGMYIISCSLCIMLTTHKWAFGKVRRGFKPKLPTPSSTSGLQRRIEGGLMLIFKYKHALNSNIRMSLKSLHFLLNLYSY